VLLLWVWVVAVTLCGWGVDDENALEEWGAGEDADWGVTLCIAVRRRVNFAFFPQDFKILTMALCSMPRTAVPSTAVIKSFSLHKPDCSTAPALIWLTLNPLSVFSPSAF
jgi:hypothetical protein